MKHHPFTKFNDIEGPYAHDSPEVSCDFTGVMQAQQGEHGKIQNRDYPRKPVQETSLLIASLLKLGRQNGLFEHLIKTTRERQGK